MASDHAATSPRPRNRLATLERGFVLGGFPDLWERCDWKTALGSFRDDLARFGVEAMR